MTLFKRSETPRLATKPSVPADDLPSLHRQQSSSASTISACAIDTARPESRGRLSRLLDHMYTLDTDVNLKTKRSSTIMTNNNIPKLETRPKSLFSISTSPILPDTTRSTSPSTAESPEYCRPPSTSARASSASLTQSYRASSYTPLRSQRSHRAQSVGGNNIQRPLVKETNYISVDYNPVSGRKTLNKYEIIRELGRGQHGKVKLAVDLELGNHVAIKVVDRVGRPRLGRRGFGIKNSKCTESRSVFSSQEEKVRREIAILKKCVHPNVVRLLEVLDDQRSRKIFLVLEFVEKGEIEWQTGVANSDCSDNSDHPPLDAAARNQAGRPTISRDRAREVLRDVVCGLEYLHFQGIIHRDIKPANLLVSKDNHVKISDFGVSYATSTDFDNDELELAKTAGTPAFFAPELCVSVADTNTNQRPRITHKIDIWALGVTMYCLIFGRLPYIAETEFELFEVISKSNGVEFPPDDDKAESQTNYNEEMQQKDEDLVLAKDLIIKMMCKDPNKRIDIDEIKQHPWLSCDLSPDQKLDFWHSLAQGSQQRIQVTGDEVAAAVGLTSRIKRGLSRLGSTALMMAGLRRKSSASTATTNGSISHRSRSSSSTGHNFVGPRDLSHDSSSNLSHSGPPSSKSNSPHTTEPWVPSPLSQSDEDRFSIANPTERPLSHSQASHFLFDSTEDSMQAGSEHTGSSAMCCTSDDDSLSDISPDVERDYKSPDYSVTMISDDPQVSPSLHSDTSRSTFRHHHHMDTPFSYSKTPWQYSGVQPDLPLSARPGEHQVHHKSLNFAHPGFLNDVLHRGPSQRPPRPPRQSTQSSLATVTMDSHSSGGMPVPYSKSGTHTYQGSGLNLELGTSSKMKFTSSDSESDSDNGELTLVVGPSQRRLTSGSAAILDRRPTVIRDAGPSVSGHKHRPRISRAPATIANINAEPQTAGSRTRRRSRSITLGILQRSRHENK